MLWNWSLTLIKYPEKIRVRSGSKIVDPVGYYSESLGNIPDEYNHNKECVWLNWYIAMYNYNYMTIQIFLFIIRNTIHWYVNFLNIYLILIANTRSLQVEVQSLQVQLQDVLNPACSTTFTFSQMTEWIEAPSTDDPRLRLHLFIIEWDRTDCWPRSLDTESTLVHH